MKKGDTVVTTKSQVVQKRSTNEALWKTIAMILVAPVAALWYFNIMVIIDVLKHI